MFYKKLAISFLAFAALFFSDSQPQNEVVDKIIKQNINAMGGYENLKYVKTVLLKGHLKPHSVHLEEGVRHSVTIMLKLPNKIRNEFDFNGEKIILAFNGKKSWMINYLIGNNKPQDVPEDLEISLKETMDFHGPLFEYKEKGNKISLIGKDRINGNEVYKLKIITKNNDLKYFYIDSSTYLIIKETHIKYKGEKRIVEDHFRSNYKETNGIVTNFKGRLVIDGKAMVDVLADKIEINIDLDDSLFERPSAN